MSALCCLDRLLALLLCSQLCKEQALVGAKIETFQEGSFENAGVYSFCARAITKANGKLVGCIALSSHSGHAVVLSMSGNSVARSLWWPSRQCKYQGHCARIGADDPRGRDQGACRHCWSHEGWCLFYVVVLEPQRCLLSCQEAKLDTLPNHCLPKSEVVDALADKLNKVKKKTATGDNKAYVFWDVAEFLPSWAASA